ncbi:LacI family DNA-binding transcriptional regulator [Arthrobacter sp. 35W]|uniref:LacI family DNA-binding transcriptional regulator n=1 Tax=Arthrobacter sp. 35W TaxID=1132441 RepID=UPI001E4EB240|nr:LacI family DNA-binding transcriptional regulator [Arthrobacter sp. 35W]
MPTIRAVAAAAGVSTATVSNVLSGQVGRASRAGFSTTTAAKVHAAAAALGYRPNQAAKAMRTGRTGTMLLSLTMLSSDPWARAMVDAVQQAAAAAGITVLIMADGSWSSVLDTHRADAIFLDAVAPAERRLVRSLAAAGTSLVVFDETLEPDGFDVVRSDALPGCAMVVEHLLRSHGSVAALVPAPGATSRQIHPLQPSRLEPYRQVMAEAGVQVRERDVAVFDGTPVGAFARATALLQGPDRPTALYASTDFAGIQAVRAAERLGLVVGEDVHIASIGNTPEGALMSPSLTSAGPADLFAQVAARLVARARDASLPPSLLDFPWELNVRTSAP